MKINKPLFLSLLLICAIFVFLRLYRLNTDLLFHRDQGLHALAVYDIYHNHKFSLLGPPSDTDGLFHSPIYYLIILPAYALSQGDPFAANLWLILLEAASLPFLFVALTRLFNRQTAYLTLLIYSFSYLMISYSRWLVNVPPILPLTNILLFFLTSKFKSWHPFVSALLVGTATQVDAAVAIFIYPFLFWFYKKNLNLLTITSLLAGFFLPALPLLIFELRHQFVISQAVLNFIHSQDSGLKLSLTPLITNLSTFSTHLNFLFTFPTIAGTLLFLWGVFSISRHNSKSLLFPLFIFFISGLSLFNRPIFGFFFTPLFVPSIAITSYGLLKFPKLATALLVFVVLLINLLNLPLIYRPTNALTPIGNANLITLQDRKNIIDWVYQKSAGQSFSLWTYTIPYFQDYPLDYLLLTYALPKYGYLPEKTANFSKNELKNSKYFFAIYELDQNDPGRQARWFSEISNSFGDNLGTTSSHDLYVTLTSFKGNNLQ